MAAGPDWRAAERPPLALPAAVVATYAAYLRDRFPRATRGRLDVVVREVSDAFTADRSALPGSYLNQPPVRSAYLAHFHPQQVLRGVAALEETFVRARTRGLAPAGAVRVADLGAGLGAMSQALLLAPAAPPVAELVLVDQIGRAHV